MLLGRRELPEPEIGMVCWGRNQKLCCLTQAILLKTRSLKQLMNYPTRYGGEEVVMEPMGIVSGG